MKKLIILLCLLMSFEIFGEIGVGFKLGTLNEITARIDNLQFGLGRGIDSKNGFSISADKLYPYDSYYYGIGILLNTFDDFNYGVHGLVGYSAREDVFEFFAEAGPAFYYNGDMSLEAGIGLRIYF